MTLSLSSGAASGALTNAMSSIKDKVSSASSANGLSSMMGNSAFSSSLSDITSKLSSSASGVLGSSLTDLAAKNSAAVSGIFGQTNAAIGSLTSNSAIAAQGPKEVADKLESIASDATAAISKPVSFVTQPINSTISGASTMAQGMTGVQDLLSGMSGDALSNISRATGVDISTSADLKNVINDVTNQLAANTGNSFSSLASLKDTVSSNANNLLNSVAGSFTDSLSSGINSTLSNTLNNLPLPENLTQGLVSAAGDILNNANSSLLNPNWIVSSSDMSYVDSNDAINSLSVNSYSTEVIQNTNPDVVAQNTASTLENAAVQVSDINRALDGTIATEEIANKLFQMGLGTEYGELIQNATGAYATMGDNRNTTVEALYSAVHDLDSGVEMPKVDPFRYRKNLFDVILQIAAEKGMTDLIAQMATNPEYFDNRSKAVLQKSVEKVANSGNPYTYSTIVDVLGVHNIPDNENNLKTLYANLYTNDAQAPDEFTRLLTKCGLTLNNLIVTPSSVTDEPVFDATAVTVMSASDTSVLDEQLGDNRQLMQASVRLFSNR